MTTVEQQKQKHDTIGHNENESADNSFDAHFMCYIGHFNCIAILTF